MKEPTTDKNIFAVTVQNPYSPAHIFSMAYANIENAGYNKTISEKSLTRHEVTKHGATSRLTLLGPSRRLEDPQELQRKNAMRSMYTLHKLMQHFHRYAAGPHPGAGESCDHHTS